MSASDSSASESVSSAPALSAAVPVEAAAVPSEPVLPVVAVRHLCEFAARSGSLDYRYAPSPTALQGIQGHQWLQARMGPDFSAEYALKGVFAGVPLQGRADLVCVTASPPQLVEIKTFRGKFERLNPGQRQQHRAQLQLYGALLCQQLAVPEVQLRLIYLNIDSREPIEEASQYSAAELTSEAERLCRIWADWQRQELAHRARRDLQLAALNFLETGFRPGQRQLSEQVYRVISRQQRMLLEAPTGLGKTLGVLFPALKALAAKRLDRVFFLTARNTGRQLALDSLERLFDKHRPPLRVLELIARDKACEYPDKACNGESCPLANGFFDRLPAARDDAARAGWLDRQRLQAIAAEHQICPWYLGHEMARWSDLLIGDVNHYFDQTALLFSLDQDFEWSSVVVIDEAHNLIERARSMYSLTLDQSQFEALGRKRGSGAALRNAIRGALSAWQQLDTDLFANSEAPTRWLEWLPDHFDTPFTRLATALTDRLLETPEDQELQQALFTITGYGRLAERFGTHSMVEVKRQQQDVGQLWASQQLQLAILNMIPADFLRARFGAAHAVILFSATLQPPLYYRDLLGLPEDCLSWQTPSPFRRQQLSLRLNPLNTTSQRRDDSVQPIARRLLALYQQRGGNQLVFFSSFQYLRAVASAIHAEAPETPLRLQQSDMSERQQQGFIDAFRRQRGQIGMAVLGGVFSEGIDLPGDQLGTVVVVTLGLPPYDTYHQHLQQRLQARFGEQADHYTWLYPGLRKVVQAAGRLIRTPDDQGHIELIDHRYSRPEVQALLPAWWFEDQSGRDDGSSLSDASMS